MRSSLRSLTAIVAKRGPYEVTVEAGKRYSWCSCGYSLKQPFCDGEHKKHGELKPLRFIEETTKTVALCGCKQTKTPPFCDGSHNALPVA